MRGIHSILYEFMWTNVTWGRRYHDRLDKDGLKFVMNVGCKNPQGLFFN